MFWREGTKMGGNAETRLERGSELLKEVDERRKGLNRGTREEYTHPGRERQVL